MSSVKLQHIVTPIMSLPLMGLEYRWSLDFVGLVTPTPCCAKYVLVTVEHFSKLFDFLASPQNSSEFVVVAFLDHVVARFGALAEVLIDQAKEISSSLKDLCTTAFIDYYTTLQDHLEVDCLAKLVVRTVKQSLRKYGLFRENHRDWDLPINCYGLLIQ